MFSASDASSPAITEVLAFEIFILFAADVTVLARDELKEPKDDAPPDNNPEMASETPESMFEI